MIVIKTANGDRFINEAEVQSVTHNKEYACVVITFKNGHSEKAFQVESMYYTNKQDVEIRDDGLMMAAVAASREYYKEMNESAFRYLERVAEQRNRMERMVIEMYESPDSSPEYRKRFVEELRESRSNRPGTIRAELEEHRTMPYYHKLRKDSHENGEEIQKEFERMTAMIKELKKWNPKPPKSVADKVRAFFRRMFVVFAVIMMLTSCENLVTRNFGGSQTIELEKGQRLVEITFKDNDLWILTEPMDSDYVPKTKTFYEDSNLGVMQGKITIVEQR